MMTRRRTLAGSSGYTVLVVDDQEEILASTRLLLEREGHRVLTAASGQEALALFSPEQVHLVLVDYFMPRMSGEEVVREIRKRDRDVQILLMTGYSGEKPPRQMLRLLDIQGYHDKAEGPDRLLLWVDVALKASAQLKRIRENEQLKEKLLANLSHEMRTPLNVILGYSEMLLEGEAGPLPPSAQEAVEAIRRQAYSLGALVNNFLNFVEVEAEVRGMSLKGVCLADFQREAEEVMALLLRRKPVSFVWQVSPGLPPVWADPQKLLLILRNLLSNAAKFTQEGEVRVLAFGCGGKVVLQVKDTGIGIAPEHQGAIFEAFYQVPHPSVSCGEGVGMGLALVRKLTQAMGGEIGVESTPGKGTTFTLTLQVPPDGAFCGQAA